MGGGVEKGILSFDEMEMGAETWQKNDMMNGGDGWVRSE